MNLILLGSFASLLAGLATGFGALLVFIIRKVSDRFLDASLGFAAGVMLAASSFSLIVPAIKIGGVWKTALGIVLGTVFLISAERITPHISSYSRHKGPFDKIKQTMAIYLSHNNSQPA